MALRTREAIEHSRKERPVNIFYAILIVSGIIVLHFSTPAGIFWLSIMALNVVLSALPSRERDCSPLPQTSPPTR